MLGNWGLAPSVECVFLGPAGMGGPVPAWCVCYFWTRVGLGEAQPATSGLNYRHFLLCFRPFPQPAGVGGGWKERRGSDAQGPRRCSRILSAPHCPPSTNLRPFGHGWGAPPPHSVHLSGGCGKVKGSLMCLGHGGKPQSLARPSFKPQFFPTSPKPSSAAWGDVTLAATFFF